MFPSKLGNKILLDDVMKSLSGNVIGQVRGEKA